MLPRFKKERSLCLGLVRLLFFYSTLLYLNLKNKCDYSSQHVTSSHFPLLLSSISVLTLSSSIRRQYLLAVLFLNDRYDYNSSSTSNLPTHPFLPSLLSLSPSLFFRRLLPIRETLLFTYLLRTSLFHQYCTCARRRQICLLRNVFIFTFRTLSLQAWCTNAFCLLLVESIIYQSDLSKFDYIRIHFHRCSILLDAIIHTGSF